MKRSYIPVDSVLVPDHATRVFQGVIYDVYQWPQEQFDGSTETFEMIKRPDSVNIILVHEGNILVSHEEQPHIGHFTALPAGMHDVPGEDEFAAAQRELQEETGYVCATWRLVGVQQTSSKIEQIQYTFLATDVIAQQEQNLDVGERIETELVSFDVLKKMKLENMLRFYPAHVFDCVDTADQLLQLPALYEYEI